MIDWVRKFFGTQSSSTTAKERLRLVLMTDHLALAPEIIENMKRDLVEVISRYVEVDRDKVEVNFEREDRALAMLANIPIVSVNRLAGGEPAPAHVMVQAETAPSSAPAITASNGGPPRRRRRRKKSQPAEAAAAH
jgi:cell division topological specificity factor